MRKLGRVLAILVTLALFSYLLLIDYPMYRDSLKPTDIPNVELPEDDASASETTQVSETEEEPETNPAAELELLYQKYPPTQTALFFRQIDESAYEELYPLISSHQLTATLLLRGGQLPGDNQKISTAACADLVEAGWRFAVGMSEDIDLSQDPKDVAEELDDYLEDYLNRIRVRAAIRPTIFFCSQGEYMESFDEVLLEHEFTTLLYVPDGVLLDGTDGLVKIPVVSVAQDTIVADAVNDVKEYPGCVVASRLVSTDIEDTSIDYTVAGLDALIQTLVDDSLIEMIPVGEIEPGEAAEHEARVAWLNEIAQLEAELS